MAASTSRKKTKAAGKASRKPDKLSILGSSSRKSTRRTFEKLEDYVDCDGASDDDLPAILPSIDLQQSFIDYENAMKMFLCNDQQGAVAAMIPLAKSSLYHSLGMAMFQFIPAMMTYEQNQIQTATAFTQRCVSICLRNKRCCKLVESNGSIFEKPNYASYTDLEAHAELCYAEALLLQAALTIIDGVDLTVIFRSMFNIKTCYSAYKACWEIYEAKQWESKESKVHFTSGVRLGRAAFNLLVSLLPPRFAAMVELVGVTGRKFYGLTELDHVSKLPGMRAILCDLTLLAYHLFICPFIGRPGNISYCDQMISRALLKFPDSVWFLAFRARTEFLRGQLDTGIATFNRAINNHSNFRQFRLLCYYELMWITGLKLNFRVSANYATKLLDEGCWSVTTHMYVKASMLMQLDEADQTEIDKNMISNLLRMAPFYYVRRAGRSPPMETLVVRRCVRYELQKNHLLLPAIELLCIMNLLPMLNNSMPTLQRIIVMILESLEEVEDPSCDWVGDYRADNIALLHYMHGCALLAMELPRSAIKEFKRVIELELEIKEDAFLVPFAVCDLAMCYFRLRDMQTTLNLLNDAKRKYTGYYLRTRLLYRVHARIDMLRVVYGAR